MWDWDFGRGCPASVADKASGFTFHSIPLPPPLHRTEEWKMDRRHTGPLPTPVRPGSRRVPESRWSTVTEFHLLVMSM